MKLPSAIKGWLTPESHPDKLLQLYAKTNNSKYLTALVDKYNHTIFHYLLSQSERTLAEDVLQTTWLKVIHKKHLYKANNSAKYWLFSIARNTLIDEFRKQQRWIYQEMEDHNLTTQTLIEQLKFEQQLDHFNALIDNLPFHQKEAFIFQQEGFTLKEIADLTDEEQETIKSRLRYAKKYIRTHLETNR